MYNNDVNFQIYDIIIFYISSYRTIVQEKTAINVYLSSYIYILINTSFYLVLFYISQILNALISQIESGPYTIICTWIYRECKILFL